MIKKHSYICRMLKTFTSGIFFRRAFCRWHGSRLGTRWGVWFVVKCRQFPNREPIVFTISQN